MDHTQPDPQQAPDREGTRMGRLSPERFPHLHAALAADEDGGLNAELNALLGDRRQSARHPVELLARLDHPDCHMTARVLDVSESGVRVRVLRRKPLNLMTCDRLRLRCLAICDEHRTGSPIPHLDVQVGLVRVNRMDDEAVELGFRFLDLPEQQAQILEALRP